MENALVGPVTRNRGPLDDFAGGQYKSATVARHWYIGTPSSVRSERMRFMMLIHHDETALAAAPEELWAEYGAFNQALAKAAGAASGERLQPSSAATTVRQREGKTDVLDGPYADTKEQFAGYFFVEAPSLDEAIAWAKRCPSSKYGSIEIRPVMDAQSWKR
jgi:hypothetical protein